MKKSVLVGAALLVGVGTFAQTQRINDRHLAKINKSSKRESTAVHFDNNLRPTVNNHNSVFSTPTIFSSQMNAFGFIESDQNCLSYNPDLNCVALFQRHTAHWPDAEFFPAPASGKSGYQCVKFTTDNGANWDSVSYYQHEVNWGRYPSGVIYNPTGNSTLANGWFVGTGPTVNSGNLWTGNWAASVKIPTGADPRTVTDNDQQFLSTTANGPGKNTYFSSYSTCTGGTGANKKVFSGGYKMSDGETPAGNYGAAIFIGSFNGSTGFTWAQDSTLRNIATVASDGEANNNTPHIAFSPDGMTGYILVNGADANATLQYNKESYQPMVWKSTDGGATWNRVNQNYDWAANNPEIFGNLGETAPGSGIVRPAFFDLWGGGIAVDMYGKLHYATAVATAGSIDQDSLGYYSKFAYNVGGCDNRPWVFDFVTDGNGTWVTAKVTDLFTSDLGRTTDADTNASMNHWQNGAEYFDYDNRINITRSADGSKVFFSWTDSDTLNQLSVYSPSLGTTYQAYNPNDNPNIYYRGMDVSSGMFTPIHMKDGHDADQGGYYFFYPADIAMSMTSGSGTDYRIPMIYIQSWDANFDATQAVDVLYIDDADLLGSEFTEPVYPVCPLTVGIKDVAGTAVSSVGQSFPNPTNGISSIKVSLNKAEDITVNVTNSIGQLMSTQTVKGVAGENTVTVDATSLNSGVYFCTIISGNSKVTRKLSVTK